jgi:hypothetical protein
MARDGASKEVTQETRVLKLLVGYQDLGALNALRHPSGSQWCGCRRKNERDATVYRVQAYKSLNMEEPKDGKKTRDSLSFDPLTIATLEIEEMESRTKRHPTSEGLNPHLTGSTGTENKREKSEIRSTSSNSSWNGRRLEVESTIPQPEPTRRAPRPTCTRSALCNSGGS